MSKTSVLVGVILLAVLLTIKVNVVNANIFWTDPCGTGAGFSWSNDQSFNGLFKDPQLVGGNSLIFVPSNFIFSDSPSDGESESFIESKLPGNAASVKMKTIPEPATVSILITGAFLTNYDKLKRRKRILKSI